MKKIILRVIFGVFVVLGTIFLNFFNKRVTYSNIDSIKYAIFVNGQSANSFPQGNNKVDVNCINAYGYWDALDGKVKLKNITGDVSCYISFTTVTGDDYLNNYILSLADSPSVGNGNLKHIIVDSFTSSDNQTVTDAGYRYSGNNPNNYILFNDELWRIIGVFRPESHRQVGKQLVKIIRNDSIGGLVWDKDGLNKWDISSLNALLNGAYYNHSTDTDNCYFFSSTIPTICDYSVIGIKNAYQNMIEEVTWYLGGKGKSGYTTFSAEMQYQYERSGIAYSNNPLFTTSKIGLMYASDYLYAGASSWLIKYNKEWSISHNSNTSNTVFSLSAYYQNDSQLYFNAENGYNVRPVLYLSPSVYRVGGTGTQGDPFIIGLDNNL